MAVIAFIGLGVMGFPMAGHLAAAGHGLRVYNRTAARARAWVDAHGQLACACPAEAAAGADFVMVCVGNDDDLRSVVLGEQGALAGMRPGAVLVDHTTASADVARELHGLAAQRDIGFVDAPVSGGQSGAEQGVLTVMCGGDDAHFQAALPIINAYARRCVRMGEAGAGQLTKMVNQLCIAGLLQGLAEGLNFGQRAGLDMERVLEVIGAGAAQSWQMDNRGRTMLRGEFDFGFAVEWMRKDLAIAMAEAARNGARLPITAVIDSFYAELQAGGGGRRDTSSLIALLQRD